MKCGDISERLSGCNYLEKYFYDSPLNSFKLHSTVCVHCLVIEQSFAILLSAFHSGDQLVTPDFFQQIFVKKLAWMGPSTYLARIVEPCWACNGYPVLRYHTSKLEENTSEHDKIQNWAVYQDVGFVTSEQSPWLGEIRSNNLFCDEVIRVMFSVAGTCWKGIILMSWALDLSPPG